MRSKRSTPENNKIRIRTEAFLCVHLHSIAETRRYSFLRVIVGLLRNISTNGNEDFILSVKAMHREEGSRLIHPQAGIRLASVDVNEECGCCVLMRAIEVSASNNHLVVDSHTAVTSPAFP